MSFTRQPRRCTAAIRGEVSASEEAQRNCILRDKEGRWSSTTSPGGMGTSSTISPGGQGYFSSFFRGEGGWSVFDCNCPQLSWPVCLSPLCWTKWFQRLNLGFTTFISIVFYHPSKTETIHLQIVNTKFSIQQNTNLQHCTLHIVKQWYTMLNILTYLILIISNLAWTYMRFKMQQY